MIDRDALHEAAELLEQLANDRCDPHDALARAATLRERHPERRVELLWDEEPALERFHYDMLVGRAGGGTWSLSLASDDAVPFALRGLQRCKEMEVVRVDGRALWMRDAAVLLGALWEGADVQRRIVEHCILREELAAHPVEISDDELQLRLDEFRAARGLATPNQTEAWLREHDLTLAELESRIADEAAVAALRTREVGAAARAWFTAEPRAFDELHVVAFAADDARELAAEVHGGTPFHVVADRALSKRRGTRAERSLLYEAFRRVDITSSEALGTGSIAPVRILGSALHLARVRGIVKASWNRELERDLEQRLFAEWLRERRERALVEWNWGKASHAG